MTFVRRVGFAVVFVPLLSVACTASTQSQKPAILGQDGQNLVPANANAATTALGGVRVSNAAVVRADRDNDGYLNRQELARLERAQIYPIHDD